MDGSIDEAREKSIEKDRSMGSLVSVHIFTFGCCRLVWFSTPEREAAVDVASEKVEFDSNARTGFPENRRSWDRLKSEG